MQEQKIWGVAQNEQHLLVVSVCQNELQKYDKVYFFCNLIYCYLFIVQEEDGSR